MLSVAFGFVAVEFFAEQDEPVRIELKRLFLLLEYFSLHIETVLAFAALADVALAAHVAADAVVHVFDRAPLSVGQTIGPLILHHFGCELIRLKVGDRNLNVGVLICVAHIVIVGIRFLRRVSEFHRPKRSHRSDRFKLRLALSVLGKALNK